jgi:hypothetical protein
LLKVWTTPGGTQTKLPSDVEATRQQAAEARDRRLAEVRALLAQAERAELEASDAVNRVKRDYTRGAITADELHELRPELVEKHRGAQAEVQRLRDQEREVTSWGEFEDTESEVLQMLQMLTTIRRAIAGEVRDSEGIDAVRAALSRLFERFVLHRGIPPRAHVELIREGFWIEPIVRDQAVEGYTENLTPILGREPAWPSRGKI